MRIEFLKKEQIPELVDLLCLRFGEEDRVCATRELSYIFSENFPIRGALVAVQDGRIVGGVCYIEELLSMHVYGLSWVAVHPDYERQGIAKALVDATCEHISREELKGQPGTVILHTSSAHGLYEKMGFELGGKSHKPNGVFFMKRINMPEGRV